MRILGIFLAFTLIGCGAEHKKEMAQADLVESGCPKILEQTLRVSEECSKAEYQTECRPVTRYYMGWPYQTCEYTTQDCFSKRGGERLVQLSKTYACTCLECGGYARD